MSPTKQYTRIGVANHKDLVDLPCVYRPENLMSVERRVTGVDGETLERLGGRFGTLLEHTFPWGLVRGAWFARFWLCATHPSGCTIKERHIS